MDEQYPHESGDVIVLGPQVFVSCDGTVLNWKGRNYVPQAERDRTSPAVAHIIALSLTRAEVAEAERDRRGAVVDAARAVLAVVDSTVVGRLMAGVEGRREIDRLRDAFAALDGQGTP